MKKTMIAVAFAVASVPMMFAAQAPAQTPANPPATQAPKAKKHSKKATRKVAPKKDAASTTGSPASK
jgi:hypothetical protein